MIGLLLLFAIQAAPSSSRDSAAIEQLSTPASARRAAEAPPAPIAARADPSARITQLPSGLKPVSDDEANLAVVVPKRTEADAAIEVARALGVIRGRGQQPTPELIAREVGPEVLDAYLNRGEPVPAPVRQPELKPEDGNGAKDAPPGITIIPAGGGQ